MCDSLSGHHIHQGKNFVLVTDTDNDRDNLFSIFKMSVNCCSTVALLWNHGSPLHGLQRLVQILADRGCGYTIIASFPYHGSFNALWHPSPSTYTQLISFFLRQRFFSASLARLARPSLLQRHNIDSTPFNVTL